MFLNSHKRFALSLTLITDRNNRSEEFVFGAGLSICSLSISTL